MQWPVQPGLVRDTKVGGQLLWDPARKRVWLFLVQIRLSVGRAGGCIGDGQHPNGLLLAHSTDLGRSFSPPRNLSELVAPQWPSLCVAPSGGNAVLALDSGELLLLADVAGTDPRQPTTGGELLIRVQEVEGELRANVSRSLLQPCEFGGARCRFDEAAMALLTPRGGAGDTARLFVVLRADPNVAGLFASSTSTDGGTSFSPAHFHTGLTSVDCQPSAVALAGTSALLIAAPHIASAGLRTSDRGNMTLVRSTDGGRTFDQEQVVYAGPSMYSNLADGGNGDALLLFERAGR